MVVTFVIVGSVFFLQYQVLLVACLLDNCWLLAMRELVQLLMVVQSLGWCP